MDVGARIEWDEGTSDIEIAWRKSRCLMNLGVEISAHLMDGPVCISVREEMKHAEYFGVSRVTYTLRAIIESNAIRGVSDGSR